MKIRMPLVKGMPFTIGLFRCESKQGPDVALGYVSSHCQGEEIPPPL